MSLSVFQRLMNKVENLLLEFPQLEKVTLKMNDEKADEDDDKKDVKNVKIDDVNNVKID